MKERETSKGTDLPEEEGRLLRDSGLGQFFSKSSSISLASWVEIEAKASLRLLALHLWLSGLISRVRPLWCHWLTTSKLACLRSRDRLLWDHWFSIYSLPGCWWHRPLWSSLGPDLKRYLGLGLSTFEELGLNHDFFPAASTSDLVSSHFVNQQRAGDGGLEELKGVESDILVQAHH